MATAGIRSAIVATSRSITIQSRTSLSKTTITSKLPTSPFSPSSTRTSISSAASRLVSALSIVGSQNPLHTAIASFCSFNFNSLS